jgi:hypothetical protein
MTIAGNGPAPSGFSTSRGIVIGAASDVFTGAGAGDCAAQAHNINGNAIRSRIVSLRP